MAVTFDTQSDTTVLNRTKVNDNFTAINTYLSNGLAVTDTEHEYHNFAVTLFTGDLASGEHVIHTVSLPGLTSTGSPGTAALVAAQHTRGGGADDAGAITWEYYDSFSDAYSDSDVKQAVTLTDDADGGSFISVTDIASAIDTLVTANSPFFVRVTVAEHNAVDICLTLWFKIKHANATLES